MRLFRRSNKPQPTPPARARDIEEWAASALAGAPMAPPALTPAAGRAATILARLDPATLRCVGGQVSARQLADALTQLGEQPTPALLRLSDRHSTCRGRRAEDVATLFEQLGIPLSPVRSHSGRERRCGS